jgi:hypothetical protein
LPADREQKAEAEDEDYRPDDRYDVRRGQYSQDKEHVRILSILYYVLGGLGVFGGLFPLLYVVLGFILLSGGLPAPNGAQGPPPEIGWFFIAFGGGFSVLIMTLAICTLFVGYNLARKRRYLFCFVIACICCLQIPLGTILGVFTIVVLVRPTVKEMFDHGPEETLSREER